MLTDLRDSIARLVPGLVTTLGVIVFDPQIGAMAGSRFGAGAGAWWATHGVGTVFAAMVFWIVIEAVLLLRATGRRSGALWQATRAWAEGEWVYFSHYYNPARVSAELDTFNRALLPDSFATAALSRDRLRQIMDRDTRYVQRIGVVRKSRLLSRRRLQGYYVVAAISRAGADRIMAGAVPTGHAITDEMLADDWETAAAMYVFGIYASATHTATARTVSALATFIHARFETLPLDYCFTRGGTERGRVQMARYRFQTIPGSQIRFVDRAEVLRKWQAFRDIFERHPVTKVDSTAADFADED